MHNIFVLHEEPFFLFKLYENTTMSVLDHTFIHVQRELSKNVKVQGSQVQSLGSPGNVADREAYKKQFTTVILHEDKPVIGIKLTVEVTNDTFCPFVNIRFLSTLGDDGALHAHSDSSSVPVDVVMLYAQILQGTRNWREQKDIPFSYIFIGMDSKAYYDDE